MVFGILKECLTYTRNHRVGRRKKELPFCQQKNSNKALRNCMPLRCSLITHSMKLQAFSSSKKDSSSKLNEQGKTSRQGIV